jgi:hypothetical protein
MGSENTALGRITDRGTELLVVLRLKSRIMRRKQEEEF